MHPTQVSQWKKELLDNAGSLFEGKRRPKPVNAQNDPDRLYAKIAQLNMELDWLKKVWDQPVKERQTWVTADEEIALSTQCQLLKVTRSVVYAQKKRLLKAVDEDEVLRPKSGNPPAFPDRGRLCRNDKISRGDKS